MAKILCVLYDDPVTGYPKSYARDAVPKIDRYPGGQTAPTPKAVDFTPGELLPVLNPNPAESALPVKDHQRLVGHALISVGCIRGLGARDHSVFHRRP